MLHLQRIAIRLMANMYSIWFFRMGCVNYIEINSRR